MRPEILNPLFAETEALPGVGPAVAKGLARLGLTRAVDLAFHLPTGTIERIAAPAASAALLGRIVILTVTPFETRTSSGRGPMRILRQRRRRQCHHPDVFQQSWLGEQAIAPARAARGGRQARSIWRRVADRPSRGAQARRGERNRDPRAGLSADRGHRQQADAGAGAGRDGARARTCRMDRAVAAGPDALAQMARRAGRSAF